MLKEKKYLIYGIVLVLIAFIGASLAFFAAKIIGDKKNISVTSADLKVIFTNGDGTITSEELEPGWSTTKTFSVTNQTKDTYKYNIVIKDLVNTFVTEGFLVYKITSTNGGYNMSEYVDVPKSSAATDTILAYSISIPVGVTQEYTIDIQYLNSDTVDQSADMEKIVSGTIYITDGTIPTTKLAEKLLADNGTILTRSDFSVPFTTTNTGTFYQATETVGSNTATVYYFAGDAKNNWVKFGKTTEASCTYNGIEVMYIDFNTGMKDITSETDCHVTNVCDATASGFGYVIGLDESGCVNNARGTYLTEQATWNGISEKDIYWRIIRTNADGSVRLLYSGTSPNTTKGYIGTSAYNTNKNDPMYVGYMYGTSGSLANNRTNENSSTIKTYIDNWYQSNLLTNYDKYISREAEYCNDRSIGSGTYNTGSTNFYYAPYTRLYTNKTPTYNCSDTNDMFTTSDSTVGNKKLTYPIALMTADEVSYAGGLADNILESPYAWYYTNAKGESIVGGGFWWTMAPGNWGGSNSRVWNVVGSVGPGGLNYAYVDFSYAVRASVSLKSCNLISKGDGRASNPYEIYYGEACTE